MSAKQFVYHDDSSSLEERKKVSLQRFKSEKQAEEIQKLKKKIEELQNALCIAFDENDMLRNELALMQATLQMAMRENEEKEEIIFRLKNIIRNAQFIERKNREQDSKKQKRDKSI